MENTKINTGKHINTHPWIKMYITLKHKWLSKTIIVLIQNHPINIKTAIKPIVFTTLLFRPTTKLILGRH